MRGRLEGAPVIAAAGGKHLAGSFPNTESKGLLSKEARSYDSKREDAQDPAWFMRSAIKKRRTRSAVSSHKRTRMNTEKADPPPSRHNPDTTPTPLPARDLGEDFHRSVSEHNRSDSEEPPSSVAPSATSTPNKRDKLWWKSIS